MESLPTAVEITIQFQFNPTGIQDATSSLDQVATDSYRLVVHLPLAEPPEDEDSEEAEISISQLLPLPVEAVFPLLSQTEGVTL